MAVELGKGRVRRKGSDGFNCLTWTPYPCSMKFYQINRFALLTHGADSHAMPQNDSQEPSCFNVIDIGNAVLRCFKSCPTSRTTLEFGKHVFCERALTPLPLPTTPVSLQGRLGLESVGNILCLGSANPYRYTGSLWTWAFRYPRKAGLTHRGSQTLATCNANVIYRLKSINPAS